MKQLNSIYLIPQKSFDFIPIIEKECGLKKDEIYRRTNKRPIVTARQIAQWLQYKENLSKFKTPKLFEIASKYPGRNNKPMNHSSIIHSFRTVNNIMDVDRKFRTLIYKIQIKIWGKIKYLN